MNIIELARRDLASITTNVAAGFAVPVQFISPDGVTAVVGATSRRHHTAYDDEGLQQNGLVASVSVAEIALQLAGYPVRPDLTLPVQLLNHKVIIADSNGTPITYVITQIWPDETLGLIVCTLGEYEP